MYFEALNNLNIKIILKLITFPLKSKTENNNEFHTKKQNLESNKMVNIASIKCVKFLRVFLLLFFIEPRYLYMYLKNTRGTQIFFSHWTVWSCYYLLLNQIYAYIGSWLGNLFFFSCVFFINKKINFIQWTLDFRC